MQNTPVTPPAPPEPAGDVSSIANPKRTRRR
jgi:hypothetical protein